MCACVGVGFGCMHVDFGGGVRCEQGKRRGGTFMTLPLSQRCPLVPVLALAFVV